MAESTVEFTEWDSDSSLSPEQPTAELTQLDLNPEDKDNESVGTDSGSHDEDQAITNEFIESGFGSDHIGLNWDSIYEVPLNSDHEYQLPVPPTGWDWDRDPRDEHQPQTFSFFRVSRCVPLSKYKNSHLERGDKIIMPPSYLQGIVSLGLEFPLFFKIEKAGSNLSSHCGVLEFDGIEGSIFVPEWMMNNLKLEEGDYVTIRSTLLSAGKYLKLQPHAMAFTELSDPKAVLENKLRDFTCLSRGDTFKIRHNNRDFYFDVLDVAPEYAISLIDTDCAVEFAVPLDYKEPEPKTKPVEVEKKEELKEFRPFTGRARRLDGNSMTVEQGSVRYVHATASDERKMSLKDDGKEATNEMFKPFMGRSYTLGQY